MRRGSTCRDGADDRFCRGVYCLKRGAIDGRDELIVDEETGGDGQGFPAGELDRRRDVGHGRYRCCSVSGLCRRW